MDANGPAERGAKSSTPPIATPPPAYAEATAPVPRTLWQHARKKNDGELIPMRPCDRDAGDTEALPTDGMDVEEVRDPDTLRRFVLEWHRCDCHGRTETVVLRPPHLGGLRRV